jgi:hypothetical protein
VIAMAYYFFTKRPEHEVGQLETGQPQRNADNGKAEGYASGDVSDGCIKAAKEKPDNIADGPDKLLFDLQRYAFVFFGS